MPAKPQDARLISSVTEQTRRTGYAVGEARRRRILEVAMEQFAEWGYHASSMPRIAKAVGITTTGLTHHFRTKEELLVEVLRERDREDMAYVENFDLHGIITLQAQVELARVNAERPVLIRLFTVLAGEAGNPDHPAHHYFRQRYESGIGILATGLRESIEQGMVRPEVDPERVARESMAMMDGLQIQWGINPERVDLVEATRSYMDDLCRQITVDGSGLPDRPARE
ncbi:TetR family transcriptional regulator [Streptomyces sp. NPDC059373]